MTAFAPAINPGGIGRARFVTQYSTPGSASQWAGSRRDRTRTRHPPPTRVRMRARPRKPVPPVPRMSPRGRNRSCGCRRGRWRLERLGDLFPDPYRLQQALGRTRRRGALSYRPEERFEQLGQRGVAPLALEETPCEGRSRSGEALPGDVVGGEQLTLASTRMGSVAIPLHDWHWLSAVCERAPDLL
jgi:hypothetical protein